MRHDPELALRMMDNGHGVLGGGADGPASTQEIDLVVGVDATSQIDGQMKIQEAGVRTGPERIALLGLGQGAGFVRRQASGAADGPVLAGQLAHEQFLGRGIVRDFLVGQEGEHPLLESPEAPFDLSFGLRAGRDQMGDAQRGEGALELGTWVTAIGGGLMAEDGQRSAVGDRKSVV